MERSPTKLAFALAALAILFWPVPASAADTKQDVRVINTPAEPVPVAVQGTATVTGGVQVTNTPTVGVDPSQNGVQVTNPVTSPVPAALQPDDLTHLRRKASDHVHLQSTSASTTYRRVLPDGTQEANWVVPPGKVLVLTDIDWTMGTTGRVPGTQQFRLLTAGDSSRELQFFASWDGNGLPHGEHHLTSGIVVPSGFTLSAQLNNSFFESFLYGHLASDQ